MNRIKPMPVVIVEPQFPTAQDFIGRQINRYTPDEFAREMARMSVTADEKVMREPEFSSKQLADKREFVVELPKAELIGSHLDHPANTRINVYKLPVLETIAAIEAAGGRVK